MDPQFIIIFSILCGFTVTIIDSKIYTVQIDGVNLLNSSYYAGFYNFSKLSVTKFNRSTFVFNADFELLTDWDENYFVQSAYYLKRRAGLNWSKNLYFYPKRPFCAGIKLYAQVSTEGYNNTNFPHYNENDEHCLLPKVNYSFSNKAK